MSVITTTAWRFSYPAQTPFMSLTVTLLTLRTRGSIHGRRVVEPFLCRR